MPNRRQSEPTRANYSPRESNAKNLSKKVQEQKSPNPNIKNSETDRRRFIMDAEFIKVIKK